MDIRMNGRHIMLYTVGTIATFVDEAEDICTVIGYCFNAHHDNYYHAF